METTLLDQPFPLLGSGLPRSSDAPHLTSLIVGYLRSTGQKTFAVDRTTAQELGMEMGFVWEEVFSKALGDRMSGGRPPELIKDGIVFSPDCVVAEDEMGEIVVQVMEEVGEPRYTVENFLLQTGPVTRVEDYKMTKMGIPLHGPEGSPTPIVEEAIKKFQGNQYNMMQAMGYCYALECDEFIHHVVYVMGNYSSHRGWFYQAYRTMFTVEELTRNWKLLIAQGKGAGLI